MTLQRAILEADIKARSWGVPYVVVYAPPDGSPSLPVQRTAYAVFTRKQALPDMAEVVVYDTDEGETEGSPWIRR